MKKLIEDEHNGSNFSVAMKEIADRYEVEGHLLDAIAAGNRDEALKILSEFHTLLQSTSQKIAPRSPEPLRDRKNMLIIMNTLFRKTVERSQVHPIYIDRFSTRFGIEIETLNTLEECNQFPIEMIKKYCYLVKNYSLATYSLLIRNAIIYINMNLLSSLSLRDVAANAKVNASYLSSQFKKEVGETLTDYIRRQRISSAVNLLNTTLLPIQDIAFQVGIEDISYFSKQFKKQVGVSPLQYRGILKRKPAPLPEFPPY